MKNKIISLIVACALIIASMPIDAKAQEEIKPSKTNTPVQEKGVFINTKNFPDKYFREYVKAFDDNKDGKLSSRERNYITYINLNGAPVTSLAGIGWFKKLEILNIAECNNLKKYNGRKNQNLRELRCWESLNLTEINLLENPNLEKLDCSYSGVSKLDLTNNIKLKNLNCAGCQMTGLTVSKNASLEILDVGDNQLKTLSLGNNPRLVQLKCWNNPTLKSIDIAACKNLKVLDCSECVKLEKLDVTQCLKLKRLECWSDYKLKELNLKSNVALEYLDCSYNELENLDVSRNTALVELNCEECNLTGLNLENNGKLTNVNAARNQLKVSLPIVMFSNLSDGFMPEKVSNVTGGIMEKINGKYKNFKFINSDVITYDYEMKEGITEKFTIKTTFNVPHENPMPVKRLAIYPDYGMIKAVCTAEKKEGATYRFALRESGTKDWTYYDSQSNEIVIKKLKKDVLYDVAAATVLGNDTSEYKQKRIYTNRVGNYKEPMEVSHIEKLTVSAGKISATTNKVVYNTEPKNVKYRFAYKVKGVGKWKFIKTSKTNLTIDDILPGKTYVVAVRHYYISPLDNKTVVYSPSSKYKYIKS